MLQRSSILVQLEWKSFVRFAASTLFALSLAPFAPTFAQQPGQRTFASAEDAGRAFFAAMQAKAEQAPLSILGPAGEDVISSGDPTEDSDARVGFVVKYREMHRFATEPDGTVTLVIGAENWPFPIPLVNSHGAWYFDTLAGKDEILFRRIGKNEIAALDVCSDLVEAQKQYSARPPDGLPTQFAQKLVSDEGRHNGLYWQGASDEFDSPINPLIANAYGKGPKDQVGDQVPFNGYFFRILKSQGPHASGGAKSYIVNGTMTRGFAFVAYPAEYGSSGVMTFIVGQDGTIYQKDLGTKTSDQAAAMTKFDPDRTWEKVERNEPEKATPDDKGDFAK
ncbi:MAG TPA: DUF2950 domain-containing protein [Candidatus Dormibacteraeota bacterium]|nr:DUF2950 domain-containing protein [Candidatus Dormibacteraeota bacterium]